MRKRLFALVMVVAIIMSTSCVGAFADGVGPEFTSYEVIVTNKDGAVFTYYVYDQDKEDYIDKTYTIPCDTKITVNGEYYDNNKLLLSVSYKDKYGNVNASDVKKLNEEVGKSDAIKVWNPFGMICLNKNGSAIRKGPSEFYDKVGTVPYNATIKIGYADNYFTSNIGWAYITYNGVTGWVYVAMYDAGYDFAMILDENSDMTGEIEVADKGVKLVDISEDSNIGYETYKTISNEIPVGTVLEFDKYYCCSKNIFVNTNYNGISGWVIADEYYNGMGYKQQTALGEKSKIVTDNPEGVKLYSLPYDQGDFLGEYLEYNTVTETDMHTHDFSQYEGTDAENYENYKAFYSFRITVNGKTGWVTTSDDGDICFDIWGNNKILSMESTDMYSEPDSNSELITTIPLYAELETYDQRAGDRSCEFRYVVYDGKSGWIPNETEYSSMEDWECIAIKKNPIYKNPEEKDKVKDIPEGTVISPKFNYCVESQDEYWYYVEYDGVVGWTLADGYEYYYGEFIEESKESADTENSETSTGNIEGSSKGNATRLSSKNLIICCVSAAGILLVGAAVTIVFVNKKKSKKTEAEENKEEAKEE